MPQFWSVQKPSANVIAAHTVPSFSALSLLVSTDATKELAIIHTSDLYADQKEGPQIKWDSPWKASGKSPIPLHESNPAHPPRTGVHSSWPSTLQGAQANVTQTTDVLRQMGTEYSHSLLSFFLPSYNPMSELRGKKRPWF